MSRVDVLVAGGGPAGLAAAITAASAGRSVVVIEPREGIIDKACGEGIMPAGVAALDALGVHVRGEPFVGVTYRDARRPELTASGTFCGARGLGVRRVVLHEAMRARALDLGVRWEHARVDHVEQGVHEVRACGLRGRWLVAADGLASAVRRSLGMDVPAARSGRARYGARRHYPVAPWSDRVEVHFDGGVEAYVTPVARDLVGVAFLFEKRAGVERFDDFFLRFPAVRERLGGAEAVTRVAGAGPFRRRARATTHGRVLFAGDAAGYLDALTGEGIAIGVLTGAAAARSIVEHRPDLYDARYRAITRRYVRTTSFLLAAVARRSTQVALLRIARAVPCAFDASLGFVSGSV